MAGERTEPAAALPTGTENQNPRTSIRRDGSMERTRARDDDSKSAVEAEKAFSLDHSFVE